MPPVRSRAVDFAAQVLVTQNMKGKLAVAFKRHGSNCVNHPTLEESKSTDPQNHPLKTSRRLELQKATTPLS